MASTSSLSRQYGSLTASERAALSIRAIARDDDAEFQRLCDSAPHNYRSNPNHSRDIHAISLLSLTYSCEQLHDALTYWFCVGQIALGIVRNGNTHLTSADLDYEFIGSVAAYMYVVRHEAWSQFCDEIGIDFDDLADTTLLWMLTVCDANLPRLTPSRMELQKMAADRGFADASPVKVEDVLDDWRAFFSKFPKG